MNGLCSVKVAHAKGDFITNLTNLFFCKVLRTVIFYEIEETLLVKKKLFGLYFVHDITVVSVYNEPNPSAT